MVNRAKTLGMVRHVLTYVGGVVAATGVSVTEDEITTAVGAIITLVGFVWSWKAPEKGEVK